MPAIELRQSECQVPVLALETRAQVGQSNLTDHPAALPPARRSPGCAPKVTRQSYNQASPFTPAVGLVSSTFAIAFSPGPDPYSWDGVSGYPMIQGIARHWNVTFADFQGPSCSAGTYALGNHVNATDAFHPHLFWGTTMVNVGR